MDVLWMWMWMTTFWIPIIMKPWQDCNNYNRNPNRYYYHCHRNSYPVTHKNRWPLAAAHLPYSCHPSWMLLSCANYRLPPHRLMVCSVILWHSLHATNNMPFLHCTFQRWRWIFLSSLLPTPSLLFPLFAASILSFFKNSIHLPWFVHGFSTTFQDDKNIRDYPNRAIGHATILFLATMKCHAPCRCPSSRLFLSPSKNIGYGPANGWLQRACATGGTSFFW